MHFCTRNQQLLTSVDIIYPGHRYSKTAANQSLFLLLPTQDYPHLQRFAVKYRPGLFYKDVLSNFPISLLVFSLAVAAQGGETSSLYLWPLATITGCQIGGSTEIFSPFQPCHTPTNSFVFPTIHLLNPR